MLKNNCIDPPEFLVAPRSRVFKMKKRPPHVAGLENIITRVNKLLSAWDREMIWCPAPWTC